MTSAPTENRLDTLPTRRRFGTPRPTRKTEATRIMRSLARPNGPARFVLMAGLQGSGKTTLARQLEAEGFLRLCPDERVWSEHGHYGRDFPRGTYKVREGPILEGLADEVRVALEAGRDVVMDHGFWSTEEREEWRRIGKQAGGLVTLVFLPSTHDERWSRIRERNSETYTDPNAMYFSESDLERHAARFEAPGPGEPHVVYTGSATDVLGANS